MSKSLPKALTSYDLLKTVAIILTIIDHIGHFFYPEEMWFRTLGRLCVPMWFFLIGYANTTKVPNSFYIGGTILVLSALASGQYLFPVNILFTMAALRIYRAGVIRHSLHSPQALRGMFLILFFLGYPTSLLSEYGALAMLMVLFGYISRHREEVFKKIDQRYVYLFNAATMTAFFVVLGIAMPTLTESQALVLMFGFAGIGFVLWRFRPVSYVDAHRYMAPSVIKILQFFGRNTLEIYVVHLLAFRAIAMYYMPEKFGFMQWEFIPAGMVSMFM